MTASALFATLVLCAMMLRENRLIAREKTLLDDAYTDALTGLPNRRALDSAQTGLLAASAARGYVVLLLDIDHFKSINDRFGHDVGDAALCILSTVLSDGARAGDVVARFGGEEFVVVLPATRAEDGAAVAERLLLSIRERRIVMPEADFSMTVSIGLVHVRGDVPLVAAIARADDGLYTAKAQGRDRVCAAPSLGIVPGSALRTQPGAVSPPALVLPFAQRSR